MAEETLRIIVAQEKRGRALQETQKELTGFMGAARKVNQGILDLVKGFGALTAGVYVAANGLKKAWGILEEGAALERTRQQFDNLAESIDTTADSLLTKMTAATQGMVSQSELIASGAQIISLGLADTEDGVVRLSNLVSQLGWDMNQVILTFANNSKMRLDALGLSVQDVEERMRALEKQGYSTDKAFDLAVIEAGEAKLQLLGNTAETTTGKMQKFTASMADIKDQALLVAVNIAEMTGAIDALVDTSEDLRVVAEAIALIREEAAKSSGGKLDFAAIVADSAGLSRLKQVVDLSTGILDFMLKLKQRGEEAQSAAKRFAAEELAAMEAAALLGREAGEAGFSLRIMTDAMGEGGAAAVAYADALYRLERGWTIQAQKIAETNRLLAKHNLGTESTTRELEEMAYASGELGNAQERLDGYIAESTAAMEAQAEAAARLVAELERIATGVARQNIGIIEEIAQAQQDLAAAQGEWVQTTRDTSGEIARINEKLAGDLTSEERDKWREILDTADEGSAEWLQAYNALQGDLSESARQAAIAARAELEAAMGQPISIFTGDLQGMEDAQTKIDELSAALRENLVNALLEAQIAAGGFDETTIALKEALGLIDEDTANAERAMLKVSTAVTEIGAAVEAGKLTPGQAASLFDDLITAAEGGADEIDAIIGRIQEAIRGAFMFGGTDPARPSGAELKKQMLSEVEGIEEEMPAKFGAAARASRDTLLGPDSPLREVETFVAESLPRAAEENPIILDSNSDDVISEMDIILAKMEELAKGVTIPLSTSGGATLPPPPPPHAMAATGLSGIIPPGFPGDSFLIGASSGERVDIRTPAQQAATTQGGNSGAIFIGSMPIFVNGVHPAALIPQVRYEISQSTRGMR